MKKFLVILLAAMFVLPLEAQTKKVVSKTNKTTTTKKTTPTKKATGTKKNTTKKNTSTKKGKEPVFTNSSIKGLQKERAQVQQKIREQEQLLRANKADVKKRLNNLIELNGEITQRKKTIEEIQNDIVKLDGNIELLTTQLETLEEQLKDRKQKYIKSMRYMARNRNIQDQMMFVFSAKNLTQMYRRLRFVRDYAAYQRTQGEMVKAKQEQIAAKHKELEKVKGDKSNMLYKGKMEKAALEGKQAEQQNMVNSLQKQQKTIQGIIDDQKKKDAALNAQIDRLIAEEVAKAKARAEAEAKAKAEAERKRKAEELARKKAEAERIERENARRIAEAKEREAKARARAEEASAKDKERALQEARQAAADLEAAERKAKVDNQRNTREVARAAEESKEVLTFSSADRALSSNFESNRGRLPIPITGGYRIVSHFGQYNVEGLKGVTLDNKGINILGSAGAQARSIFNGEVSAVFSFGGQMIVMVRHGKYISVYCNLKSVSVHKGQKVSTRQVLGSLGSDHILQFQLRKETAKLNPEAWLGR
ncbi:MAG: peptidoglycan DD-metalloendopeptidase family protein [Prevotella sp.]|nr:peptidoglycan DD-metalloendopeptidase family protein [Prevotella sp.]